MVYISRMPSYPHIERYQADKLRLIEFGGSDNEQSIRRAFADLPGFLLPRTPRKASPD